MSITSKTSSNQLRLGEGSRIAVIGSGPAGSFFSYFLLGLVDRLGYNVELDIYERQDFTKLGPVGCNHCGGIISESLTQILAAEGINLPSNVIQRGLDSYVLHTDEGSVRIETPLQEKRIAALHRGAGPLGAKDVDWRSFDGLLQEITREKGANVIHRQVTAIEPVNGAYRLTTKKGGPKDYDLIVGAVGVNSTGLKLFEDLEFDFEAPGTTKTYITEFHLGRELINKSFGGSMHVFLLNHPNVEFAALIPKVDYVTLALIGKDIDKGLISSFLESPRVKECFPQGWNLDEKSLCQCHPKMNIKKASNPYADRLVLIGDCAVTKLYKNGIGAAYYSAKAAASTAVLYGVSEQDFRKHYWPACQSITYDNALGRIIFKATRFIQKGTLVKRGMMRMALKEQSLAGRKRQMSMVLWDTFTGSAPYKSIILRGMKPLFIFNLAKETLAGLFSKKALNELDRPEIKDFSDLGKIYEDGEIIINQAEEADCLYVIQSGLVEVIQLKDGKNVWLTDLKEGDFFGEMALFEKEMRSSTVKAKGRARVLTVDKTTLFRRIQEDPSLAFRIIEHMSARLREISLQISRIKAADRRNWNNRPEDGEF